MATVVALACWLFLGASPGRLMPILPLLLGLWGMLYNGWMGLTRQRERMVRLAPHESGPEPQLLASGTISTILLALFAGLGLGAMAYG